ncbi:hypothetical protein A3H80_00825 [Candidatus Roizmanbacteria bacterium RIFCSPLOWO2_02_FULL_37_19]|uniref:Cell division protein FtsL n=1 Tax=Candidatus Roizmanbacteria bacterium RIFCSPHIGHO2_02_FULL_37_24 TaxID=1802037 RepID=A0A1F7GUH7_9BACT|nr:MAG: hypothetical protein A3C24_00630 [Candidatus Roizmanbacteria bacterium RIFCSPHIGHO2_02_FULL_37_24]OGK32529.1 MAG: hypothetical protein A3E10_00695 [Candidatus Roizmanbacteria bacterium RIFCSPHIGHO2_12_FULL_37_23]OGK43733.1 MAG: hypothetical protein A2956_01395 [Candidatus Roizmanbacteria bacterium RIFCSPLOWO2_01_FULL_37_57]OGK54509.1 MAG: hypothetical protein A3H80_00825 [Candidatus Roizmanbacteria bacterium RIFCSPLOWO2_02_FULL_37_19]
MFRVIKNIILSVVALFLIFSLSRNIFDYKDKLKFYHEYRREYEQENELNKRLKSELKKSEDYYFIEKQIREKLNLLQPQEEALILPKISTTPTLPPVIVKKPYEQWLELLIR